MLEKKLEQFNNLCGDWDFRNIDMTDPHLAGIAFNGNTIEVYCELFSPELDDYISCDAVLIKNKDVVNKYLVNQFKNLNLTDEDDVLDFINDIEDFIDWDKVRDNLQKQIDTKLENNNMEI